MDRRNAMMGLGAMGVMGGLNPKPLNAPPAGPLSLGIQPGAPTGVFSRLIVSAAGTFTGIFVYSPSPGAGNLIDSVAAAPGTDPFGNAYKGGITSYLAGGAYSQLQSGQINVADSAGDTFRQIVLVSGIPYLQIIQLLNSSVFFGQPGGAPSSTLELIGNQPGSPATPEIWHTMTITAAGFSAGTQAPQYQFMPLGSTGQVHLRGAVNLTANQVSGTAFFVLPAGWRPSTNQEWVTASSLSAASLAGTVSVDTAGNLALGSAGSTGNLVRLDGIVIQL